MGGGTGANLEHLGDRLRLLEKIYLVDLSPSLLAVARRRIADHGWNNVEAAEADATAFRPPDGPVDVVTFSYSLTMIPDWFAALEQAWRLLRPGGLIGVVDFFVAANIRTPAARAIPGSRAPFGPFGSARQRLSQPRPRSLSAPTFSRRCSFPNVAPACPVCRPPCLTTFSSGAKSV